MSTSHSAKVSIKNNMGGSATIFMSHMYGSNPVEHAEWTLQNNQTSGQLTVNFKTHDLHTDHWYCLVHVHDGPNPGVYTTIGAPMLPVKMCMLRGDDAGQSFTNTIDMHGFHIKPQSGGCDTPLIWIKHALPPMYYFVLMLENHSFDHVLGNSAIQGTDAVTGKSTEIDGIADDFTNVYNGKTYHTKQTAVDPLLTDPGHEFMDILQQLTGVTSNPFPKGPYPKIDNSGFVTNYATSDSEHTGVAKSGHEGDVMGACDSANQVPILNLLAQEFAVCDNWYSSLPGPTLPNRLFAMAASSSGMDGSPSSKRVVLSETIHGIKFQNGSFFELLYSNHYLCRIYNDRGDAFASDPVSKRHGGAFALASTLKHVHMTGIHNLKHLPKDLSNPYPYPFTFIEPNYGNVSSDKYTGGSSQHPMDSLLAGEELIAFVYNTLRASPIWNQCVLIITYDEHGGYFDHAVAPVPAPPPGDKPPHNFNEFSFDFKTYGVRVPAVIVSPLIPQGLIDHTLYDHTSILKTIEKQLGLPWLTNRDKAANDFSHLISLTEPRTAPSDLSMGDEPDPEAKGTEDMEMETETETDEPLPERGNVIGMLQIAAKADFSLSDGSDEAREAIIARVEAIKTRSQARDYFEEIMTRVEERHAEMYPEPREVTED